MRINTNINFRTVPFEKQDEPVEDDGIVLANGTLMLQ
jgi:hypothetical protein